MCVARYLNRQYNIDSTPILTQIPTQRAEVITIGTDSQEGTNWANMGSPGQVSRDVVNKSNMTPLDGDIDIIDGISITFRLGDLQPFSNETALDLTAIFSLHRRTPFCDLYRNAGLRSNQLGEDLSFL